MVKSDQFQDDPWSVGMFQKKKECRKARRRNVGDLGPYFETISFSALHSNIKNKFTMALESLVLLIKKSGLYPLESGCKLSNNSPCFM